MPSDEPDDHVQGYPVEEVQEGEIIRESPITGERFVVTRWVEKGEDRVIALEKEAIDDG